MLLSLVLELKDKPGQLLRAIEPISRLGGNIIGVVHKRDRVSPLERISVEISVKIDEGKVEELVEALKRNGVVVKAYNEVRLVASTSLLLVGHIIHTDLSDTINTIDATGFAEVVEMHISMPEVNQPSTAMVTVSATGKEELKKAVSLLKETCRKKDIMVIEPLNEDLA